MANLVFNSDFMDANALFQPYRISDHSPDGLVQENRKWKCRGATNDLDTHDLFRNRLSHEQADMMIHNVTTNEVKSPIFSMSDDQCLDGFTLVFFKEAWDVAGIMWVRESEEFTYRHRCSNLHIVNLCFADELFLFAHGDVNSAHAIMDFLEEFKAVSRLVLFWLNIWECRLSRLVLSHPVNFRSPVRGCDRIGDQSQGYREYSGSPETSTIAPVISSAAPVVETTLVASPTGLWLAISPFICTDSSEAPDSSDGPPSQDPYVATVARWRSRVTARTSSSHEFPIAPVTAPPGIRRRSATLIRPGEAIPFGRPYRTHLNGPLHSLGLDAPDQAHSGSSTRDVSPRLCYPPRRAPRRSEAFRRWCAAPLSTLYPPTTSESSSGDSSERPMHSSPHSAGPSHSYSSEASLEEDAEVGLTTGLELIWKRVEATPNCWRYAEVGTDLCTAPLVEEEIAEPSWSRDCS
ncbi:hypothetical protein Tco_1134669 [Tanacetum coccineum]